MTRHSFTAIRRSAKMLPRITHLFLSLVKETHRTRLIFLAIFLLFFVQIDNHQGRIASIFAPARAASAGDNMQGDAECWRAVQNRPYPPLTKIRGRLLACSTLPSLEQLAPYANALFVCTYEVVAVQEGEYADDKIYVAHWGISKMQRLPFGDASLERVYELVLAPLDAFPELENEYLSMDVVQDFQLPIFYDAGGLSLGIDTTRDCQSLIRYNIIGKFEKRKAASKLAPTAVKTDKIQAGFDRSDIDKARARDMALQMLLLETEVQRQGGWEAWHNQVSAFKKDLSTLKKNLPSPFALYEDKDGNLFKSSDFSYHLVNSFVRQAPYTLDAPQAISLEAIIDFSRQLKKRGIDLIFVPVPSKSETAPEAMSSHVPSDTPVSPQRTEFMIELLQEGVEVIDLLPAFRETAHKTKEPLFLRRDHHWNHLGIAVAAREIANRLRRYNFPGMGRIEYETTPIEVIGTPSIFNYISEEERAKYLVSPWKFYRVTDKTGQAYQDDENSPIVVIGDSFSYFSSKESSGITAHLANELGMSLTLLGRGGGGPRAPAILAQKGSQFIRQHRVVVWLMSSNYLVPGRTDWVHVKLP